MRKEVKRSLLIWPATASATITAMSFLVVGMGEHVAPSLHVQSMKPSIQAVVLETGIGLLANEINLSARSEHGERAMKLPERVAEVFNVEGVGLKAPVLDEQSELAGLVVSDIQSIEKFNHQEKEHAIADSPPPLVGPSRPQFWEPELIASEHPLLAPPSVLPESNRALARRLLTQQPETRSFPSAADSLIDAPAESNLNLPLAVGQPEIADATPVGEVKGIVGEVKGIVGEVKGIVADTRTLRETNPASWPATQSLDDQLKALSTLVMNQTPSGRRDHLVSASTAVPPIIQWTDNIAFKLNQLRALPRLGDTEAGGLIDELSSLAIEGSKKAEVIGDRQQQMDWLRASYAVARRVAVWRPVWEVTRTQDPNWMVGDSPTFASQSIQSAIEAVRVDLEATGDQRGWATFLLLDELQTGIERGEFDERTVLAQRFLSRLDWHGLQPEQRRWLERSSIQQLKAAVRPWAQDAVDYASLLSQLERQEADAIDMAAIDIAEAVQTLRFADNAKAVAVADALNTHYRNANVRLALSQLMLQRVLPSIDPQSVPVRTQMFGSRVHGMSRIESDLNIELTPSPDRWSLKLKAAGNVRTQSTGLNGPVAVRTSGNADFVAATPIEVTPAGVQVGDSTADVRGRTKLRGIRTDYDGWPLISSLVRSIAESRYESLSSRSNRISNQKIQTQVESEIDNQLDARLGMATKQLSEMILGPLGQLRLAPQVMDMQTTDQRLLARYRLAGDWQLGAFTARPRAPSTSLMSVQVHQSAVNNTLEQLVPRDEPLTIHEIIRSAATTFGQTDLVIPDEIPEDVTIQFARTRPVTVEIEDGILWVTLRIVRLRRGERIDLTRFIVRAAYRPQVNGVDASLVRDGHLRISGPGMSMRQRLPVRAIFNKVLSPNRPLPLTLPQLIDHPAVEGLAVSQLELRGGWIGLAISESDAPRIALKR